MWFFNQNNNEENEDEKEQIFIESFNFYVNKKAETLKHVRSKFCLRIFCVITETSQQHFP